MEGRARRGGRIGQLASERAIGCGERKREFPGTEIDHPIVGIEAEPVANRLGEIAPAEDDLAIFQIEDRSTGAGPSVKRA